MALKKDSKSLDSEQEKSQNEDVSLLELKNLENKTEIESQSLEVSKENNNELGLSNGDVGVLIGLKNKRKYLFRKFNDNNEEIIALIDPSKLESVVPAIAITIHKSQGSESEKVNVLWSQNYRRNQYALKEKKDKQNIFCRDNFERRLFYTAITRAKKFLDIYYLN